MDEQRGWTDMQQYKYSKILTIESSGGYTVNFFNSDMFEIFHNKMLNFYNEINLVVCFKDKVLSNLEF